MPSKEEIKKFNANIERYIAHKAKRSGQTSPEEIVTDRQGYDLT